MTTAGRAFPPGQARRFVRVVLLFPLTLFLDVRLLLLGVFVQGFAFEQRQIWMPGAAHIAELHPRDAWISAVVMGLPQRHVHVPFSTCQKCCPQRLQNTLSVQLTVGRS